MTSSSSAGRHTGSFIITDFIKVIRNVIAKYNLRPKNLWTAVWHISGTAPLCVLLEMSSFRFTSCRLLFRVYGSVSFAERTVVTCFICRDNHYRRRRCRYGLRQFHSSLVLPSQIGLLYRPWMVD